MERFFIPLYRFFEKRKALLFVLMIASTLLFIHFGLKVVYEENIAKLLPQTDAATESGLAFENLRVKDKIFVQFTAKDASQPLDAETLADYNDTFMEAMLEQDTATHYIANALYRLDDDLVINALDYALMHAPTFVDESCYARFDSLLTAEAIEAQMTENRQLIDEDEEGNLTMMVTQDPAALRKAMMQQGLSLAGGVGGFTMIDNHLFSPDSTVALAFISPNFSAFDSMSGILLIERLEKKIEKFEAEHPEVEILFHGTPVQGVFNSRQIRADLWLTIGLSIAVICFVIGICFKNKSTLLMLLAPVVYGTFFALSCIYWMKGGMSLMAIGIGAIVLGIAMSYCLHVLTHFKYMSDPVQILRDQATPVCLGCLTTIGAFLGLLFTESDLLKDFGLFASFGMVGTTLFSLIFLPHFFPCVKNRRSEKAFKVLDGINSYPIDRKKSVRYALIALCLVCFFTSGWVTFDSNLRNIGYNEPKVIRSNELYAAKNNGGYANMYYAVNGETLDDALMYNRRLVEVFDSLQQTGELAQFSKATALFIPMEEQEERIALWKDYWTPERIGEVRRLITQAANEQELNPLMFEPFYTMLESDYEAASLYESGILPESLLSNFIEETNGGYMVFTSVKLPEANKMQVNDAVAAQPHAVVIDPYYYTNDMIRILNDDFNTILSISSVFVFLILLLSFRSVPVALLAFIPMGLSWYVVQGVMGIFGLQFNLINIIIATFIFGVGVDYSIFVMTGLIAQARGTDDKLLTYHKTAIFFSALILMVVVGSLLFATHPALHSVGVSTLIGMSATILITYALQPWLFRCLLRFKSFRKKYTHENR